MRAASSLLPTRFLLLIAHLIVAITVFWSRVCIDKESFLFVSLSIFSLSLSLSIFSLSLSQKKNACFLSLYYFLSFVHRSSFPIIYTCHLLITLLAYVILLHVNIRIQPLGPQSRCMPSVQLFIVSAIKQRQPVRIYIYIYIYACAFGKVRVYGSVRLLVNVSVSVYVHELDHSLYAYIHFP